MFSFFRRYKLFVLLTQLIILLCCIHMVHG